MKALSLALLFLVVQLRGGTGSVTGRILGPDGMPIANMRVAAASVDDGALNGITQTDSDGRYRLQGVAPGRYYITAGPVDLPTYFPGVTAKDAATIVSVAATTVLNDMNFMLSHSTAGFKVAGRVVREGPLASVPNLLVSLAGGRGMQHIVQVSPDGSFEFSNVSPGGYSISLSAGVPHIRQSIRVVDRDIANVELLPRRQVVVLGLMQLNEKGPRPQMNLVFESGSRTFEGRFSTNGTLTLELQPGEYRLKAPVAPAGFRVNAIRTTTADLMTSPMVLKDGDSPLLIVELAVSSPPPWVKVSGRLLGTLPEGAKISLSSAGLAEAPQVAANPDGTFEFPQVLPGSYVARVAPSPAAVQEFAFVVGNADLTGVEYTLPEMRRIRGRVNVGGTPALVRTSLTLLDAKTGVRSGSLNIVPNAQGEFTAIFPPGEYRVQLPSARNQNFQSITYGSTSVLTGTWIIPSTGPLEELSLTFAPSNP